MNISGSKYLNNILYDSISIKGKKTEFNVNITKEQISAGKIHSTKGFLSEIKGLSDEERIKEIVYRFLNYSTLNYIKPCWHIAISTLLNDLDVEVRGLNNKVLSICVEDNKEIKNIYYDIFKKYIFDRSNFINEHEYINNYFIGSSSVESSYGVVQDPIAQENDCIKLTLFCKNYSLDDVEKEFFTDFLMYKLYKEGEQAIIESTLDKVNSSDSHYKLVYYVKCGSLCVRVDSYDLLPYAEEIVNLYNEDILESKKNQLTLNIRKEG